MKILPNTNRQLHLLLTQSGNMAHKAELVIGFTSGRTEHSSEMMQFEAINLISWLKNVLREPRAKNQEPRNANESQNQIPKSEAANTMRRAVLACCHTMHWYKRDSTGTLELNNGKPQLDYARIDAYCLQHSASKKVLNAQSETELRKTVFQFRIMAKNYLNK